MKKIILTLLYLGFFCAANGATCGRAEQASNLYSQVTSICQGFGFDSSKAVWGYGDHPFSIAVSSTGRPEIHLGTAMKGFAISDKANPLHILGQLEENFKGEKVDRFDLATDAPTVLALALLMSKHYPGYKLGDTYVDFIKMCRGQSFLSDESEREGVFDFLTSYRYASP